MNYKYVSFFNFSDFKESAYDQYHSFSGAHMDQLDQLVVWLEHFDLSWVYYRGTSIPLSFFSLVSIPV